MSRRCQNILRAQLAGLILFPLCLLAPAAQAADIRGALIKVNDQRVPDRGVATIRWMPSQKRYLVTVEGGIQIQVPLEQVRRLEIPKPANLDAAIQAAQRSPSSAIPVLKDIADVYTMLEWDVVAARWLGEAYMKMKQYKDAVDSLDKVAQANPGAVRSGELFKTYCEALRLAGMKARLKKLLLDVIENGSRETVALAQIVRADMDVESGDNKGALVDGYLRTILLFQDIRAVQPEALYKAMKAHEKLGEHSHAEKWKRKLLQDYPDSTYSRELRGAS